jgi:hypothetical protein
MSLDTLADLPVLTDVVVDWPDTEASPRGPADTPQEAPHEVPREAPSGLSEAFPASAEEAKAADAPAIAIIEREVDATATASEATADARAEDTQATLMVASEAAPPPFLDDDFILEIPPLHTVEAPAPAAPSPLAEAASPTDDAAWAALAEELRMQVLQRLDLFTDTGLREQLGERLSPIVERASTQMIETINRELGELVRAYVAEAIEREIETWRKRSDQ